MHLLIRFGPVIIIALGVAAFYFFGLDKYVTFSALKEHRHTLLAFVQENLLTAVVLYMVIYVVMVALSLPGGAPMTITGGFLFGAMLGAVQVLFAATLGATLLFLTARLALGDALKEKAGPWMKKLEGGFKENALSYLLVLRLVPLFPFFVVNLVPAFLNVRARVYIIGTFFGIMPGTFVFTSIGSGIGSVFDAGEAFSPRGILTTEVIIALIGLSVLALAPVIYKQLKKR